MGNILHQILYFQYLTVSIYIINNHVPTFFFLLVHDGEKILIRHDDFLLVCFFRHLFIHLLLLDFHLVLVCLRDRTARVSRANTVMSFMQFILSWLFFSAVQFWFFSEAVQQMKSKITSSKTNKKRTMYFSIPKSNLEK